MALKCHDADPGTGPWVGDPELWPLTGEFLPFVLLEFGVGIGGFVNHEKLV